MLKNCTSPCKWPGYVQFTNIQSFDFQKKKRTTFLQDQASFISEICTQFTKCDSRDPLEIQQYENPAYCSEYSNKKYALINFENAWN